MKVPRIRREETETVVVVEMNDVRLQWSSEGVARDALPAGNPSVQYAVWMSGTLLCMTPVHAVALHIAELQAADQHHITDLTTSQTLLAGHTEWLPWPHEPLA